MKIEIRHRATDAIMHTVEIEDGDPTPRRTAVLQLIAAHANLAGANLAGANLAHADLAGANLAHADLAGANLAGANLAGANLARANLARAYLADAYLADAYLARADLAGADLAHADLAGANLAHADLAGANLAHADLAGAYLAHANLARANLADAYLADAYLADAYLAHAYLAHADLAGADLAGANLARAYRLPAGIEAVDPPTPYNRSASDREYAAQFRERHPEVPVVENLDRKILDAIAAGGVLDMDSWHGQGGACGTTHCRAGFAIHLAGQAGIDLERKYDSQIAGRMIYLASTGRAPHFFARTDRALEDIKRCAAEDVAGDES